MEQNESKDLERLKSFYSDIIKKQDEIFFQCKTFADDALKEAKKLADKREQIRKEYNLGKYGINILDLPEFDWDENAHSKVLCKILDPKTPIIGEIKNLKTFFKIIGLTNDEINEWSFHNIIVDTEVTEKKLSDTVDGYSGTTGHPNDRIDILIYDNKNCVIIENKLKNAVNQSNQIERYAKIAEGSNPKKPVLKIHKIVYMPITNNKKTDICPSTKYKVINEKIKKNKWLVKIPAVKSKNCGKTTNSLVQDFFPVLLQEKLSETNKTRLVFLEQYRNLIAKLGEDELMSEMKKKLLEFLYNKENVKSTLELKNILDSKNFYKLKQSIIDDKLGLQNKIIDNKYNGKIISKEYGIYFFVDTSTATYGIYINKKIAKKEFRDSVYTKLKEIFKDYLNDKDWISIYDFLDDKKSIESELKDISDKFAEAKKIIKTTK